MQKFRYYNHALVPDAAPHENVAITDEREFWSTYSSKQNDGGGLPILARWTTDFDCGYETNWWYLIRKAPYDESQLKRSTRKHLRDAYRKCYVKQIEDSEIESLYACYESAYVRYENPDNFGSFESVRDSFLDRDRDTTLYYGAYDKETNRLIGYFVVLIYDDYIAISSSKFDARYMSLRPSDILHDYVLNTWLNKPHIRYANSGNRSINHVTNVQEYKINTFGFMKAYCKLHISYNPRVRWLIKLLYPFRGLIHKLRDIGVCHQVDSVLFMESLCRGE